jgi:hypothetical protein
MPSWRSHRHYQCVGWSLTSCKTSSNNTSNCRKNFSKFLKNNLLLQSTLIVTRHEMWFDVSEVATDSVFGEVSKPKKLRERTAPQPGINFTSFRSRLKMNEASSFETSENQWHDIITQKNRVIIHTAVKASGPQSHSNSAGNSPETDECAYDHWWRSKNSHTARTGATLMCARNEKPLWHSNNRSVCSKRCNI